MHTGKTNHMEKTKEDKKVYKKWMNKMKTNRKYLSCLVDRNTYDAISTRKIPENTRPCLVFPLGISPVEMTSSIHVSITAISQHRDTQAIFYMFKTEPYL